MRKYLADNGAYPVASVFQLSYTFESVGQLNLLPHPNPLQKRGLIFSSPFPLEKGLGVEVVFDKQKCLSCPIFNPLKMTTRHAPLSQFSSCPTLSKV